MKNRRWVFLLISTDGTGPVKNLTFARSTVIGVSVFLLLSIGGLARLAIILCRPAGRLFVSAYESRRGLELRAQAANIAATLDNVLSAANQGELSWIDDTVRSTPALRSETVLAGFAIFPGILDPLRLKLQHPDDLAILHGRWRIRAHRDPEYEARQPDPGYPSVCPAQGRITSFYGIRTDPIYEGTAVHRGIDIAGQLLSPVHATADGVVAYAGWKARWGNVVMVDHKSTGYRTLYAHLHHVKVSEGQTISRHDVVGYLGNTGKSTGPHLHYEVHLKGRAINPLSFILPYDSVAD